MLSTQTKSIIEKTAQDLNSNNPFFQKAQSGELSEGQIKTYLNNILFLLEHTQPHLELAKKQSLEFNKKELAALFDEKIKEESGHDQWAKNDLATFDEKASEGFSKEIKPSLRKLITHIENTIKRDPHLYFSYITFSEYLTVLLTPQIAKDFNKCGVSPERISAIVNHGELDKEHTADDFLLIDQVIAPQTSEKDFIETLEKAADITFDFFTELSEQTTH